VTLLEAMACACPIVATDVGGNPEIVRHGREGLLVPRAAPRELAAAVMKFLDDEQAARSAGLAARERVIDKFQWQNAVRRFSELYRGDLSG
jgi:glycosyltransferase involved in cell wall biosynthesis